MSTFLKPLAVLFISILVFAGIFRLTDKNLPEYLETRFYNPSVIKSYITENAKDAEAAQKFIFELQEIFAKSLDEQAVRNSFLYNQSAEDIYERSRIYGILLETIYGLQSVQFVDMNGIRLHYSTLLRDIITRTSTSAAYRNYTEDETALPYDEISVPAGGSPKFIMDEQGDRIIFSYPFMDSLEVYHGTAVFSVSIRALSERLIAEGRIKVNENISVITSPAGVLFGCPDAFKEEIQGKVSEIWNNGIKDRIIIDSETSGIKFSLISFKTDSGIFFGRLVNDELFVISDTLRNIFYITLFLTFYLVLYFIINFRPGSVTIVHNRIRRLRETLMKQLYEEKSTQERIKWLLELEQRRDEIKIQLKNKLKIRGKTENKIDLIIDKSWDEIIAIVRANSGHAALALKLSDISEKDIVQKSKEKNEAAGKAEESGEPEEAEELLEEVEELAEEIEEVEEAEAADEPVEEPAEDLSEEIEEAEEIEELIEDAEPAEELVEYPAEDAGELIEDAEEPLEAVEEPDEIEDIEEMEESAEEPDNTAAKKGKKIIPAIEEFGLDIEIEDDLEFDGPLRSPVTKKEKIKEIRESGNEATCLPSEFEIYDEVPAKEISLKDIPDPVLPFSSDKNAEDLENINLSGGLLAKIIKEVKPDNEKPLPSEPKKEQSARKGLLALSNELGYIDEEKTEDKEEIIEEVDDIIKMDIVSPFVSMFSNLDDVKLDD